jgi:hypothetical protein
LTVSNLGSVSQNIYYDKIGQQVRWDRAGNLEQRGVSQTIISWSQYNVGPVGQHPEYVYFVEQGKCFTYGADEWNDWCFGLPVEQQSFVGSTQVNGVACSVWENKLQGFTWVSRNSPCLPVSTMQSIPNGSVQSTLFHNTTVGIKDMSVFDVPSVCKKSAGKLSDMPQHLRQLLVRCESSRLRPTNGF